MFSFIRIISGDYPTDMIVIDLFRMEFDTMEIYRTKSFIKR